MKPSTWLKLFFILVLVALCEPLVLSVIGMTIFRYTFVSIKMLALPALFMAVYKYSITLESPPQTSSYPIKVKLFGTWIFLLLVYGIARGNGLNDIVFDTYTLLVIFAFLILGKHDQVWKDMEKFLVVCFWICFALVLIGFSLRRPETTSFGQLVFDELEKESDRWSVTTAGYRVRVMLNLWPLLFALAYMKNKMSKWKMLGLLTAVGYLGLQVFFQKRAPAARAISYVAMAVIFIPFLQRRLKIGTVVTVLVGFSVLLFFVMSSESMQNLRGRFRKDVPFMQSSRIVEAKAMISELNAIELFVGRGMGGYFVPPTGWGVGDRFVNSQLVRTSLHVGVLQPMLKGGLLFCLLYVSFVLPVFLPRSFEWYSNPPNLAAVVILPVYILFLFIEGPPTTLNVFDAVLVGMTCSRLGTRVPDIGYDYDNFNYYPEQAYEG